ncbi:MAG TPA: SRPBCC domain-containing protein [Opitutaceae bacterium]|jgi:uncharacterized protein YndB with AHSA1/START domain|nr:SRPBCC domain-containing protein [Opitutaceae bacterium]
MSKRTQTLQIIRQLKHDRASVFSALTDPAKMAQWFFGMKNGRARVTNDLRPGGTYTIEMIGDNKTAKPKGTYLEIVPPEKLVFTWLACTDGSESKVTVELFKQGAGTKLVLTHELPEEQIQGHREGWGMCFDNLELYLGRALPAA